MTGLLRMEADKLWRLSSVRFSLLALLLLALLWAYAPGIFEAYGFFVVSAYQVPALALRSSMQFLLPLLVAISSAELLGIEVGYGTLPTILLRPVTRQQWLVAKIVVIVVYTLLLVAFVFVVSLAAGALAGYGPFVGGVGLTDADLLGSGVTEPAVALAQLGRAYLVASLSLVPVALLSLLLTVVFMSAAAGALATLGSLIVMNLLVIFPWLEPFLLSVHLSAFNAPVAGMRWVISLLVLYGVAFATAAVVLFERRDF